MNDGGVELLGTILRGVLFFIEGERKQLVRIEVSCNPLLSFLGESLEVGLSFARDDMQVNSTLGIGGKGEQLLVRESGKLHGGVGQANNVLSSSDVVLSLILELVPRGVLVVGLS